MLTLLLPEFRWLSVPAIHAQWHHNYIIITSSIGITSSKIACSQAPPPRFGRWSLSTNLHLGTFAVTYRGGATSRLPPRDCVSRSKRALECAPLCCAAWSPGPCRVPIPEKRDRSGSLCGLRRNVQIPHAFFLWLSHVASSLAEPRARIRECLTPRVYVAARSNAISHVV